MPNCFFILRLRFDAYSIDINNKINQKKRKILGYLPAEKLFLDELAKLNVTENTIFYKN